MDECKALAAGNIGQNTKIFLNGERIKVKGFSDYVDLYLDGRENSPKIYEKINDRWEAGLELESQCMIIGAMASTLFESLNWGGYISKGSIGV